MEATLCLDLPKNRTVDAAHKKSVPTWHTVGISELVYYRKHYIKKSEVENSF